MWNGGIMSSNKSRIRKALKRFAPKVYYGKYFKKERVKWHGGGKPIYMFTPNPDHVLQSGIYEDLGKMGVKVSRDQMLHDVQQGKMKVSDYIEAIITARTSSECLIAINKIRAIPHDGC